MTMRQSLTVSLTGREPECLQLKLGHSLFKSALQNTVKTLNLNILSWILHSLEYHPAECIVYEFPNLVFKLNQRNIAMFQKQGCNKVLRLTVEFNERTDVCNCFS